MARYRGYNGRLFVNGTPVDPIIPILTTVGQLDELFVRREEAIDKDGDETYLIMLEDSQTKAQRQEAVVENGPYDLIDISTHAGEPELLVVYDSSVPGKRGHTISGVWACPYCRTVYRGVSKCARCDEQRKAQGEDGS